jgi:TatD DNase family protein
MLTDSHCHLDRLNLDNHEGLVSHAIATARQKGVKYMLCPGVTLDDSDRILQLVEGDNDLFAAIGLHPTAKVTCQPTYEQLVALCQQQKIVAIGETGLDFSYGNDATEQFRQKNLLELHIRVAKELDKPLIVHSRDAGRETMEVLVKTQAGQVGGIMHCFTGSKEMADAAIALGFYISFSGIITFPNAAALRQIAKTLPLDRIIIETDAPYLAPQSMRGKPNEPAYLPYIAEYLADFLNIPYETFAKQTTENFLRCCKLI